MRKTDTERLEDLKKREAELKAKIATIKARKATEARKEDNRLKVLVGAALLADAEINDETRLFLRSVLPRAVTTPRDREFLQAKGWLLGEPPAKDKKP
ncbi:MAG: mobilization protein C [Candidatus Competibacter sp.]